MQGSPFNITRFNGSRPATFGTLQYLFHCVFSILLYNKLFTYMSILEPNPDPLDGKLCHTEYGQYCIYLSKINSFSLLQYIMLDIPILDKALTKNKKETLFLFSCVVLSRPDLKRSSFNQLLLILAG
jgi:hypothetical protein